MHALFELIANVVAALAVAAFAQFGVDIQPSEKSDDAREVRRTDDRPAQPQEQASLIRSTGDC